MESMQPSSDAPPPEPVVPRATYRLQFHRDFPLSRAMELLPWLDELGISHIYASPILCARPGSRHGYDIVDHTSLNGEIGSLEELERLSAALKARGMGLILDMVPNHMGIMGADNAWWLDVLESGPAARHAEYFDIDWRPVARELHGKVLVPVLADQYGKMLDAGRLTLAFAPERGEFSIHYEGHRFPVDPREYPRILGPAAEALAGGEVEEQALQAEFLSLVTSLGHLPARDELLPERREERARDKEVHKRNLARLSASWPALAEHLARAVARFDPARPEGRDRLHELIQAQAYRLAYWRVAADDINYRRFFDVNDLAALRMEREDVFQDTHRLILDLLARGLADGLRIDHPDGLFDPRAYLERLRRHMPPGAWLVVEKILAAHERLPADWPVQGTTGYTFANLANGLFVDGANQGRLDRVYRNYSGETADFDQTVMESRRLVMEVSLASELNVLANQLAALARADRLTCDFTFNGLRRALVEIMARFPVYRTYVAGDGPGEEDRRHIVWAVAAARRACRDGDGSVYDFVQDILLSAARSREDGGAPPPLSFAMKFQQVTAPVMAKGLEDTAFYRYNRLLSLNEVGGDPRRFGVSPAAFHNATLERWKSWPHAMSATSTHDSKRSADVRCRIDALSEMPALWRLRLSRWKRLNRRCRSMSEGSAMPDGNDEYLFYQTLLGIWPVEGLGQDGGGRAELAGRLVAAMTKAVREAKRRSSWINPDAGYEAALAGFIEAVLDPERGKLFLRDFLPFQRQVARIGMLNSLSLAALKFTAPGVPDLYQGEELWDFSLMDPDNRRAVAFPRRQAMLAELAAGAREPETLVPLLAGLRAHWVDGRAKLWLTWRLLSLRRRRSGLFSRGDYLPLPVSGSGAAHLLAFARVLEGGWVAVLVPRLCGGLLREEGPDWPEPEAWGDTTVDMSMLLPSFGFNVLSGESVPPAGDGHLHAAAVLARFPVAVIESLAEPGPEPGAG